MPDDRIIFFCEVGGKGRATSHCQMNSKLNPILVNQASRWYARLRAPDCSSAERHAFRQWLESGADHERAYHAAMRAADQIRLQAQSDPRLQALAARALDKSAANAAGCDFRTAVRAHWRSAAMLLVSVGAAALLAAKFSDQPLGASPVTSYVNNEAHERQVELSDGTTVHLDVGTEVSVVMTAEQRRIELTKGRAFFEVAHDKSRPFSVTAAGTRTVALGTRFEVALLAETVNVSLAEGSVAITDVTLPGKWREVLTPGQQLQIHADHDLRERLEVDASVISSWSKGRLIFNGMPLEKALDEINRYASVKVHLGDSELANIPIGGNFVVGADSNEFVETLAAVLPLRSVRTGANEIVLFHKYETRNP